MGNGPGNADFFSLVINNNEIQISWQPMPAGMTKVTNGIDNSQSRLLILLIHQLKLPAVTIVTQSACLLNYFSSINQPL